MVSVSMVLQMKGGEMFSTSPESTVFDALKTMAGKNVGALLVLAEGTLVGIFSERDYARKVVLRGKFSRDTLVRDIMTPNPITVRPDTGLEECMRIMTTHQVRHLPVLDGIAVAGVISIGDVVKVIIESQQDMIGHLERYIVGR
jgi:CBS domain-containing protein